MTKQRHVTFFEQQIKAYEDEWLQYAECSMKILVSKKKLFIGRIWGVKEDEGLVVLRFREGEVPRMKQSYFLGMVGADAPANPLTWSFSYRTFRESHLPGSRYHSGSGAEIFTVNYWKTEGSTSFVLVSGFEADIVAKIREKYLDRQAHPMVVVAMTDPPTDYLLRLRDYVSNIGKDPVLDLNLGVDEQNWQPMEIDNGDMVSVEIMRYLEERGTLVIQGPPGTGKSHLAAEICEEYLKRGHSVCVTALTNRALMELANKKALRLPIKAGKVYKTNLSSDETKTLPGLKRAESIGPIQGELLLSTYYKLSQSYSEIIKDASRFDLVIIEEASQAYLATIAMFASMASKFMVIGDHRQLFPIIKREEEARESFPQVDGVIHGLQTFAFNRNDVSYRLTNTRRLTPSAAALTGLYYGGSLKSISNLEGVTNLSPRFSGLFNKNGGVTIARLPLTGPLSSDRSVLGFIVLVAREIMDNESQIEVAILTPHSIDETEAYVQYGRISNDFRFVTISTVHKIQGLTTELTIYFLPRTRSLFGLVDNIFNVATSRAKRGTLIVAYNDFDLKVSVSAETRSFIRGCEDVSKVFIEMLSKEIKLY
jgi:molybdopterin-guanine dinucleotide biosynthesis protein